MSQHLVYNFKIVTHQLTNSFYLRILWRGYEHALFSRKRHFNVNAFSRAAKHIHCAQNVKTVRLDTKFNKSINNIFLIFHILWYFQDGRH